MNLEDLCAYITQPEMKKTKKKGQEERESNGSGYPSGLILHSPLASGIRVLRPSWSWWPSSLDIFPVAKAARKVWGGGTKCLVIHGTTDDVVPFGNGKAVYDALPKESRSEPLWIEGVGHCDLEGKREYLPRLLSFLKCEAR